MTTNISKSAHPENQISTLLTVIGQPARIQILAVLNGQEACVCHLEAALGMRQASISQHLTVLRKAGLVVPQRNGRHVFYHLGRPEVGELLARAAQLTSCDRDGLLSLATRPVPGCSCPQCNPGVDAALTCKKIKPIPQS